MKGPIGDGRRSLRFAVRRAWLTGAVVGCMLGLLAWVSGAVLAGGRVSDRAVLLGQQSINPVPDTEAGGHSEAFSFTAVRPGEAGKVYLYIDRPSQANVVDVGLYADQGGNPGRLLSSGSTRHPAAGRWNSIAIRRFKVRRGGKYWLAMLGLGGSIGYRDRQTGSCYSEEAAQSALRSAPTHWIPGRRWMTCSVSAYLTGRATGPTSPRRPPPHKPKPPRPSPPPPHVPPATAGHCFSSPGACGFPDPGYRNVGASSACSSLPASGSVTTSFAGQTIANVRVLGTITVTQPGVTIKNVCVINDQGGGATGVQLVSGARGTVIQDSTIGGANATDSSVEIAVANGGDPRPTLERDYLYYCGECIHDGPWTVNDSYVISNGMQGTPEHYEDVYYNGDVSGAMSFSHDTLLNPFYQTAVIFSDTYGSAPSTCHVPLSVKGSLIAGGEYMLTYCGKTSSQGSVRMDIENNRFARCTTQPFRQIDQANDACSGGSSLAWEIPKINGYTSGSDAYGYWRYGGSYTTNGMTYCGTGTWSGNVWDNNAAPVDCQN